MTRRNRRLRGAALAAVTAAAAGTAGLSAVPAHAAPPAPAQPGDFNGDGHRDLALGSPLGTANGAGRAGFATIAYGTASGPDPSRRQVISQESAGIPAGSEADDGFGASLASADFDLDGYADLAVVASGENSDGPLAGGSITVVYGSASGLSSRAVAFGADDGGENRGPVTVSAADVTGRPDLVAGGRGSFTLYRGLASGDLTGTTTTVGHGEGETVRVSTTAADFTGDGHADLAYAYVWDGIDGQDPSLRLNVYKGSSTGLAGTPAYTSSDAPVQSLAAGDVDGDGRPTWSRAWTPTAAARSGCTRAPRPASAPPPSSTRTPAASRAPRSAGTRSAAPWRPATSTATAARTSPAAPPARPSARSPVRAPPPSCTAAPAARPAPAPSRSARTSGTSRATPRRTTCSAPRCRSRTSTATARPTSASAPAERTTAEARCTC
ncbi:hypothetical protein F8568_045245 [Actinomadura sp. LD22]|uniref:VCBS repeat-containing protein n=1 Tax=Actinomadura physcomitrii TaxID=2650748 RepID=A0A6I4MTZ6_9ACTN|nr:hypothetical protein [Actinomadura physcomitrii]